MLRLLYFLFHLALFLTPACSKTTAKPPKEMLHTSLLSEQWHSHDATKLTNELSNYFSLAETNFPLAENSTGPAFALVVPHAAYYYSGLCAATGYQALLKPTADRFGFGDRKNNSIKRVIILAPCHTMFYQGAALPICNVYRTPLGDIPVDTEAVKKLSKAPPFNLNGEVHLQEHGVEMQLPMLQHTVAKFSIVPLVLGHLTEQQVFNIAHALQQIIDDQTLIVVSSDFTHYGHTYDFQPFMKNIQLNIRQLDSFALQALSIPSFDAFHDILSTTKATICGQEPLRILLALLSGQAHHNVHAELACYYTSAQIMAARNNVSDDIKLEALFNVASDKQSEQSVSYASMVYHKNQPANPEAISLNAYEKKILLTSARTAIEKHLQDQELEEHLQQPIITPSLEATSGVFVSLKTPDGRLRGCIGNVATDQPLYKSVPNMALAAAFADKRFLPLAPGELANVTIEISMLTQPKPIKTPQEIVLAKHGIILEKHDRNNALIASALFLPGVARQLKWSLEETLEELSIKAGLPADSWKENTTFAVFEAYEIKETHE